MSRSFAQAAAAGKGKAKQTSAKEALLPTQATSISQISDDAEGSSRAPLGQADDSDSDDVFEDANPGAADDDDELMIGTSAPAASSSTGRPGSGADAGAGAMDLDPSLRPNFAPLSKSAQASAAGPGGAITRGQMRKVPIPPHRMTPLKNEWAKIYTPLVEMAGLQVRMNVLRRSVEIRVSGGVRRMVAMGPRGGLAAGTSDFRM